MFLRLYQRIRSRIKASDYTFMMLAAAAIGVLGGLGAALFRYLISLVQRVGFGESGCSLAYFESLEWWHLLAVPAAGGLIVGPIVYYFAREARGHGVPEVMEAVALKQGVIRKRIVVAKTLASAITIGSGGSVGREGPIVQIGSAIGSTLGQILKVSRSKLRTMVGCGAAAGIAATFNAPVAGVLFSLEVILGDFGVRRFTPIVISSVIATAVSHALMGNTAAFDIAIAYEMVSPVELISYSLLGVAAGLVALLFSATVYRSEDLFEKIRVPALVKPVAGGLLIGFIALRFPHIFGVGYETIEKALNEEIAWHFLLILVGVKVVATSLTLGSGGSGGVFAPSLFIGAVLGGGMGHAFHRILPEHTASSGAYALVGMGALVSAATHAPLTSIMIIFEMTGDYKIILPLMFACIIGNAVSSGLRRESIYTMKLFRRGVNIFKGRDANVMASLKVSDVTSTGQITIGEDLPLGSMLQMFVKHHDTNFYVVDGQGVFKGVVSVNDLREVFLDGAVIGDLVIARDVMDEDFPRVRGADTLDRVMYLFGADRRDELPVVDDRNSDRLIGVVTRQKVISAYNGEILKRDAVGEVLGGIGTAVGGEPVVLSGDIAIAEVEASGWMVGRTLAELSLRQNRGIQVLMINPGSEGGDPDGKVQLVPQPDYRIALGDNLLVLGPETAVKNL
jgi:chloride channel protein, CIC family